jgi:hypothetical protein
MSVEQYWTNKISLNTLRRQNGCKMHGSMHLASISLNTFLRLSKISQGILHLCHCFYTDMILRKRSPIQAARIKRNASCTRRPSPVRCIRCKSQDSVSKRQQQQGARNMMAFCQFPFQDHWRWKDRYIPLVPGVFDHRLVTPFGICSTDRLDRVAEIARGTRL